MIPFAVSYRVEHRDGRSQQGEFVVYANTAAEARLMARERIWCRCGEHAAWVNAQPERELARA